MTFGNYSPQTGWNTLFMKTVKKYEIHYHISSPSSTNENPVEGLIR